MSVRNSLLAVLTMGPAYGFQLHGELARRTGGRRSVNVGQIYATLERLMTQGAVESAGTTADGLPLYGLTDTGRTEAVAWLHDTRSSSGDEWNDMLERVMIASSLPHIDLTVVVAGYRSAWQCRLAAQATEPDSGQDQLADAADAAQGSAALAWLTEVAGLAGEQGDGPPLHRELSGLRPKRGRRPAPAGSSRPPG
ncbi:PadR family transcriptional regulator [Cryobacterium sp. PAMC25264]|uniref:PadR family transcriptional regulator n=1 Tax=Cryobacterium sp. PAMC25264 TaxID=2861288 RepID=UPI001C639B3D|nr:helix-turn-helix transcriptional regulator [Cryobacterium sp. PAMC25264]QYF74802.1 PadR family transcriptional regulator [Cryobacterium sp. PAMC25264]